MAYDTAVVLGFLGIAAIMAYLAMNVDRKQHGAIQILFIFVSMLMQYAAVGAVRIIMDVQSITAFDELINSVLAGYFWVIFFTQFYLMMMFVWNMRKLAQQRKKEDQGLGGEVRF